MNSSVITYIIASIIVAVVGFVLLPQDFFTSNISFALGVVVGGIFIPVLAFLVNRQSDTTAKTESSGNSTTLYVGNLPYRANEQAVRDHFAEQGKVISVRLMKDRRTGKRKGYGFVEMDSKDADRVIKNLNDTEFQERTLKVRLAKDKVAEE